MNDETKNPELEESETEEGQDQGEISNGENSSSDGEPVSSESEAGDPSEVSEAGHSESDTLQNDGRGRSPSDSEDSSETGEEEKVSSDEVDEHSSESSSVALPDGVQIGGGQEGACIRISQKYKGGWVDMSLKQWEEVFNQVEKVLSARTK